MMSLEPDTLRDHQGRTVYLAIYSQADVKKMGNRKEFADIATGAFNQNKLFNPKTVGGGGEVNLTAPLPPIWFFKKCIF